MSTAQDKFKNSKRRFSDEKVVKKQSRIAKQHNPSGYVSPTELEPHRYHKHHAMDCGNPECHLCGNPRRTHKDRLTPQEKRLFQDVEQTRDRHSNGLTNDKDKDT